MKRIYQFLCEQKKQFLLSKKLLRSGTSVGAIAEQEETKNDFNTKWELNPTKLFIDSNFEKNRLCDPRTI
jgi:hypothetical protein